MNCLNFLGSFLVLNFHVFSQEKVAALDKQMDFVEYERGTVNIILSVPHGGLLEPDEIPDRMDGCLANADQECAYIHNSSCAVDACKVTTVTDSYTIDLSIFVADTIELLLGNGKRPHRIVSNLRRRKLDPNREIKEAAQNVPLAEEAYNQYHGYIEEAKSAIGRGILIDLHGQNHQQNSSELGYLLSKFELNAQDYDATQTSIRTLAMETGLSGEELLTGPKSLGAFLEAEGFKAVPSPRQPFPGDDQYYSGGYITKTHGSVNGGLVDAIQIETPREVRVEGGDVMRGKFGNALGAAIVNFYNEFYT